MDNPIILIAGGVLIGAIVGYIIAKTLQRNNATKLIKGAKKNAASIIKEANIEGEAIKKDKILQAKEKFIELKSEHEKVILSRDKKMAEAEKRTRDKESQISNELSKNKQVIFFKRIKCTRMLNIRNISHMKFINNHVRKLLNFLLPFFVMVHHISSDTINPEKLQNVFIMLFTA